MKAVIPRESHFQAATSAKNKPTVTADEKRVAIKNTPGALEPPCAGWLMAAECGFLQLLHLIAPPDGRHLNAYVYAFGGQPATDISSQ